MMRLDFGSAFEVNEGWVAFDKVDYGHNVVGDALQGLPFPDDHFDSIVSNHSLQCLTFDEVTVALKELLRVLKPGGTLRVLVPDMRRAIGMWEQGNRGYFPISPELEPTLDGAAFRYIYWHGDARSGFTGASLSNTLERNGFRNVALCRFGQTASSDEATTDLDSREAESLIVEGMK